MKFTVSFRCRPVGAQGAFLDRCTVEVDVPTSTDAIQAAIPVANSKNVELCWSEDWARVFDENGKEVPGRLPVRPRF